MLEASYLLHAFFSSAVGSVEQSSTIPEMITAGKEIVIGIPAGVGAYVAWSGVNAWKDQLKGTSQWDVGKRLVVSIRKMGTEILRVQRTVAYDYLVQHCIRGTKEITVIGKTEEGERTEEIRESFEEARMEHLSSIGLDGIERYQKKYSDLSESLETMRSDFILLWYEAEAAVLEIDMSHLASVNREVSGAIGACRNLESAYQPGSQWGLNAKWVIEYVNDEQEDLSVSEPEISSKTKKTLIDALNDLRSHLRR